MAEKPFTPSDEHLRRRYLSLLQGDPVIDGAKKAVIQSSFERWREIKRLVIVHGLPRDEGMTPVTETNAGSPLRRTVSFSIGKDGSDPHEGPEIEEEICSLRGRIWKLFLGVEEGHVDVDKYRALVHQDASPYDSDIRNDTFRTFRGDAKFAERVPEKKLVRLLNAFFNDMNSATKSSDPTNREFPDYFRYVQGMNVLCAPLLYVMPEEEAYQAFYQLILQHCPKYMAPQLAGVEHGCALVDRCLETLDPELYQHLCSRGITARIYALPLILSLFACVPPLQQLLRVWDVLFAVGVHFVVLLAVARTILLRDQLLRAHTDLMAILSARSARPLESDQLIAVAFQLLHRLPDDVLHEIARHPLEDPDTATNLPFTQEVLNEMKQKRDRVLMKQRLGRGNITAASLKRSKTEPAPASPPPVPAALRRNISMGRDVKQMNNSATSSPRAAASAAARGDAIHPPATSTGNRPPWKF